MYFISTQTSLRVVSISLRRTLYKFSRWSNSLDLTASFFIMLHFECFSFIEDAAVAKQGMQIVRVKKVSRSAKEAGIGIGWP
jgi:hypothetical protein